MEEMYYESNDFLITDNNELILTTALSTSSNEDVDTGSNKLAVIFLLINAALGAGLLNFPQAFDQAGGIVTALSVQALLLFWIVAALIILAYCSDQAGATTLQEVLEWAWGRKGLWTGSLAVALYCFGTCITFLIIIGDQYDRILSSLHGSDFCHYWYMNRSFTIATSSTLLILPFCYSRRIDFLKYVSSLGVVEVMYVVFLIVYEKYSGEFIPGPVKTSPDHWTDVFLVIPVICFGYQCHVSVIPIYSCLKERNLCNFTFCVSWAIAVCAMAYTLAGVYGYLTFGLNVSSDILESYDSSKPVVLAGIIAIAVKTYTTYPLLLFCGREAVANLWCNLVDSSGVDVALNERRRRIIIASSWFILTLVLTIFSPDIGSVIDLLGSLAAIFIFVFPGLCLMQSTLQRDPNIILNKDKFKILGSVLFILFGAFLSAVVLIQASIRLATGSPSKTRLCD